MTEWNPDFVTSSLSRTVTRDGITVRVDITRKEGTTDWSLSVTNAAKQCTHWEDPFATDDDAYAEFEQLVAEEGMQTFLEGW
jgi:uncharacterized protein